MTSSSAKVEIENLDITFRLYDIREMSLKKRALSNLVGGRLGTHDGSVEVAALKNINLIAESGDRIGLIGHNGSGKSTLLRAIAGIYPPTSGRISLNGRVTALLDFGAGLELEASGYENIFFRGFMLGRSRAEIARCVDEVINFTELENFIYLPIRTYSAGMLARLSFAISTAWKSEILLIDEGIGAGDAAFQEKAKKRIADLFSGAEILFIASHSDELIDSYCNRRLQLNSGVLEKVAIKKNLEASGGQK